MTLGPYTTWELIRRISASIPCLRRVKDCVEIEINHFLRGKSHTSPDAEEDICNLQKAYQWDAIHQNKPGRTLDEKDKAKDFLAIGCEGTKLSKAIERWIANRDAEIAITEEWDNNW